MKYEKSCGAVIWRKTNNSREYLLILNKKGNAPGHWGFPKGHIEPGESEIQTAAREIREETGLIIDSFDSNFRKVNHYSPRQNVEKDAVYFLAESGMSDIEIQHSEVVDYRWCSFEDAAKLITHDSEILNAAENYLNS